jgi:[glutamine synthetase] adenylyltransferase / [glutamine synthetase]-adenylyl-L-tyrosine phosphorylase
VHWTRSLPDNVAEPFVERLHPVALGKFGSRQMHYSSDMDLFFLYDADEDAPDEDRARAQQRHDERIEKMLQLISGVTAAGIAYRVDLRLRPEGGSGLLARSWGSFLAYAREYMQPWERMALVRSRLISSPAAAARWAGLVYEVSYAFDWDEEALGAIRHLKRRIETEKNRESRTRLDFKYGKGGIVDLEFFIQFLQITHGSRHPAVRVPGVAEAIPALCNAGALSATETATLASAHRFMRHVENHYQLIEEWNLREVSRESSVLNRLARSLGYAGGSPGEARRRFLAEWDEVAHVVRSIVEKHFYGGRTDANPAG